MYDNAVPHRKSKIMVFFEAKYESNYCYVYIDNVIIFFILPRIKKALYNKEE